MDLEDFIKASAKDSDLIKELENQAITDSQLAKINSTLDLKQKVIEILKTIKDPEIPVNIWDLGLIYDIRLNNNTINISMTLTAPTCPIAGAIPIFVEKKIKQYIKDCKKVKVQLVWQPQWDKSMMSDEGKFILDMW